MAETKTAKKKIVLIHPQGENWVAGETDMTRLANIMPPIGLCSLAAWVDQNGHQSFIHDCYAFPGEDQLFMDLIEKEAPEFVGLTATTSAFMDAIRIAKKVKGRFPDVKILLGGAHISALRQEVMAKFPIIDFGVVGEGENTLLKLMEWEGEGPYDISGLLYRWDGQVVFTGFLKKEELIELDDLPYPAYDKLKGYPQAYKLPIFNYPKAPNTTVVSSRGCPYTCSYCDRTVFKQSYRFNTPEYTINYVRHLRDKYGIRHINFYDDLFTLHKKRVRKFCELMKEANLGVTFNIAARAEHLDEEMLQQLKSAGCWMISLGIETGDPQLLEMHRSNSDLDTIREKVKLIRKAGIRVKGLFILGLPGETEESIDRTFDYALGLPINDLNLTKFTPFPGSPVYATVRDFGEFDENWEQMNCTNFVFIPKGLTKERMEQRYMEFYRRHFERPHILWSYVTMLWHSPNSWYRLLLNLKDFLNVRSTFKKGSDLAMQSSPR